MKALAFANDDIAVVAWTFGGKLPNCLGFAIYRIDVRAGTETCLPAMATFSGQQATPGRTTAEDPVQKFFWKDVYAQRGGTYKYKIVPMTGTPGNLRPMPYAPWYPTRCSSARITARCRLISIAGFSRPKRRHTS